MEILFESKYMLLSSYPHKKFSKLLVLSFALAMIMSAANSLAIDGIRFDGMYQAHFGDENQSIFLRFYPDKHVVAMSFIGSLEDAAGLVSRLHSELPQGTYLLDEPRITFTTKATNGEIDYVGIIRGDKILFYIHSRITNFSNEQQFTFHVAN